MSRFLTQGLLARLVPHPMLTLLLAVTWCLLINDLSLGTAVFGLIAGWIIPILTAAYWPNRPRVPRPHLVVGYALIVIWDILVANVVVAALVVFRRNQSLHPCWVAVPLDIRKPEAITILAGTITLTPGTVSADLSSGGHALLVHALNADDPDAVRDEIKERYESRLKRIFE